MPKMLLICGPNGAGKSSLRQATSLDEEMPVIDPDRLARESGLSPIEAGKEAARRARGHITAKESFARESTMTARFDEELIRLAKRSGYDVELFFVGLNSADLAIERVAERVAKGGHDVPSADVVRRYERGLASLGKMLGTVDRARVFDNTRRGYRLVMIVECGKAHTLEGVRLPSWVGTALKLGRDFEQGRLGGAELDRHITKSIALRVEAEYGIGM